MFQSISSESSDARALSATADVEITGSKIQSYLLFGRSYTYPRNKILTVSPKFKEYPEGSFTCSCCSAKSDLFHAYAIRLMDDGGMTLWHDGLVCAKCLEECPYEVGGWPGAVRIARLSNDLFMAPPLHCLSRTTDDDIKKAIREFHTCFECRNDYVEDISLAVNELYKRKIARKYCAMWLKRRIPL